MTALLTFRDYGFTYASAKTPALSGVNLELHGGAITSVIAPQGSGKTTLLRAAAGLLGAIYNGEITGSVTSPSSAAFFDGYVQVTLAVETVREELALPLYAAGVGRSDRDARVVAVARELVIEHLLDRPVTALSGGEEKLVGIAAALVPDVAVYVLDEPFEQLDVMHLSAVIRAARLRARDGRLVLLSTGSLDVALNLADVAVLFDGSTWSRADAPTYETVAGLPGLGESPVTAFLGGRHASPVGVRRFRDAVRAGHPESVRRSAPQDKLREGSAS